MADGTVLNIGSGGDTILTEQPGGSGSKIPVSKIYTGALDANGGPVTAVNPFAVAAALRADSIMNGVTSLTPKFAHVTLSATGEFIPLVNGKKLRVLRYSLMADAACEVYFKSHTTGQISGSKYLVASGGAGGTFCAVGHFETIAGEALDLVVVGTANVSADATYVEV